MVSGKMINCLGKLTFDILISQYHDKFHMEQGIKCFNNKQIRRKCKLISA